MPPDIAHAPVRPCTGFLMAMCGRLSVMLESLAVSASASLPGICPTRRERPGRATTCPAMGWRHETAPLPHSPPSGKDDEARCSILAPTPCSDDARTQEACAGKQGAAVTLPPRLAKKPKRESRWRSQAHCNFVRSHACSVCHATAGIEVAHVRIGSGAGLAQKPDDWHSVSLCRQCHSKQHSMGEQTFWRDFAAMPPAELIDAFCWASPKASEIARIRKEKEHG